MDLDIFDDAAVESEEEEEEYDESHEGSPPPPYQDEGEEDQGFFQIQQDTVEEAEVDVASPTETFRICYDEEAHEGCLSQSTPLHLEGFKPGQRVR